MARLKHIAIRTRDVAKTASFYREAFDLQEVGRGRNGVYLSDGYINLAILKFKTEEEANTEGGPKWTGMHHFGFNVEAMPDAEEKILRAGATLKRKGHDVDDKPRKGNVEVKFTGPDGITIDLSETGWVGQREEDEARESTLKGLPI